VRAPCAAPGSRGHLILIAIPLLSGDLYYQNMLIMTFLLAIGASGWNIMADTPATSPGNSAFIGLAPTRPASWR